MSIISRVIASAIGLAGATAALGAPEHKWTMAIVPVTGTVYYELAQSLPDRISKATNGRVELTVNGSLIAPNRVLEAVRDGQVQMSMPILGYYTATQPLLTLTNLPGLAESMRDLDRILDTGYGAAVRDMYAKEYNAKELMTAAFCPQTFFSSKPVNTIEDWKGLRVRVNNAGTAILANTAGAKPVSLSAAEIVPALQHGVIDAVVTDSCWAFANGVYTAAKFASEWKIGVVQPFPMLVNQDVWAKLPKDLQLSIADELARIGKQARADYAAKVAGMPQLWGSKNVKFHVVSEVENKKIHDPKYMDAVYEAWYKQADARGIDGRSWVKVAREATAKP
jgi:TRAP-type C4-dicarboxylate transport system substrate-binding protein